MAGDTSPPPSLSEITSPDGETLTFQVDPPLIVMINFLFKGYGHLAVVRTLDPETGLVELLVSPDTRTEVERIIRAFLEEEQKE